MSKIFFTSDTHYNHKNICKGVSDWTSTDRCRDFSTVKEMNDAIVDAINSTVGEDDTLYHLGDWSFGGINSIWEFRKRIKCRNIHLILGNHDHHIENDKVLPNAYFNARTKEALFEENKLQYVIDRPEEHKGSNYSLVLASYLFSSISHYKEVKFGKGKGDFICLSHYAMRVWNKSHHGSIMLHGHSHGTLPDYESNPLDYYELIEYEDNYDIANAIAGYAPKKYKTMDVGVDTRSDFKPYSLEEVLDTMSTRTKLLVDHHDEKTN